MDVLKPFNVLNLHLGLLFNFPKSSSLDGGACSTCTIIYMCTARKITNELPIQIVKIAEALLEGADSSKIESLVAEASNELVEEEKETTTTTTAS